MTIIRKVAFAATGIALAAGFGGVGVAAADSPSTTLTVQDADSGNDGAAIDSDGTQGDYKAAVDGSESGPIMVATPQDKAKG